MTCLEFIQAHIDETTKPSQLGKKVDGTLIPLPYPFTTPCASGAFQEMYYWDAYFANKALYLLGRGEQAVNNLRNMAYLLENYGKIPNGNRTFFLNRSQPPFFGAMLEDALRYTRLLTVEECFTWLEKEYDFWQTHRAAPNGLNAYGCDFREDQGDILDSYERRTGISLPKTEKNYRHVFGECESGWDFNPRFSSECNDYCAIDLNCLLYKDEVLLSGWAQELGKRDEAAFYARKAAERKEKLLRYCRKDGLFFDYNYAKDSLSTVLSAAALFAYWVGVADGAEGLDKTLSRIEGAYGVYCCDYDGGGYQWSKPNSWAPLNWIAVAAARAVGEEATAQRLAQKYLSATEKIFAETGNLWEKYNGVTGDLEVASEYGTPPMLGWTAGVYVYLKKGER